MQRIRVLVVDDHRIFAESLAAALAAEQDVEVAAAGSAPAALRSSGARARPTAGASTCCSSTRTWPRRAARSGRGGVSRERCQRTAQRGRSTRRALGRRGAAAPAGRRRARGPPRPASLPGSRRPCPATLGRRGKPGGIPLVGRVRSEHPAVRTVVLAERDDPRQAAAALQAGAGGWVAKDCSLSRLLQVIRGVLKDETHLPPALLTGVLKELTASRKHRTESERLVESLTPREREVLRCMVAGLGRKAVAERLYLSPHTVRTHMQNVLGKLGVHSTLAAVALARRAGVGPVDLEPSAAH